MQDRNLWYVDLQRGVPVKVSSDRFHSTITEIDQRLSADWSGSGEWTAYNGFLPSGLQAVFLYSLTTARTHQVSDSGADAESVSFDPGGQYLYFLASTNVAAKIGWLEMSAFRAASTYHVFAMLLNARTMPPSSPAAEHNRSPRIRARLAAVRAPPPVVGAGDVPAAPTLKAALLGADFETGPGRYRFKRILTAGQWNPQLRAPLAAAVGTVSVGEYLLAVDGIPIDDRDDIHRRLLGKAEKAVRLQVGPEPDGAGSREIIVMPVEDELALRRTAERTGGRIAYLYLPDTGLAGMRSFDRAFHAQAGLDGAIVDTARFHARDAEPMPVPRSGILGPKVLLINEYSASDGDYLPWAFRRVRLGLLVGQRTWDGLVGIVDSRFFVDGGFVTAPEDGFYTLEGKWEVENAGAAPDVVAELDPYEWRRGHDLQLESAIDHVSSALVSVQNREIPLPAPPRY